MMITTQHSKKTPSSHSEASQNGTWLKVALITGVKGLKGEVRIKSFTDDPHSIETFLLHDEKGQEFALQIKEVRKDILIAKINGINNRDDAEALKGTWLYAERNAFAAPDHEEYFHADLIGLNVFTSDKTHMGTVRAVHNFGSSDILEIENSRSIMIPFNKNFVPVVDINQKTIIINPPEDLLDNTK